MSKNDAFGDRMKSYEGMYSGFLGVASPVYMRLDGRGFSKFTKGMERPFDPVFSQMMIEVAKELMRQFHCDIAYTQSDEISLGWKERPGELEFPLFGGKIQKLTSVIPGLATASLNQLCYAQGGRFRYWAKEHLPHFDGRVFQIEHDLVSGKYATPFERNMEMINAFIWREQDAKKNAISMAAQHYFSHKELQGKRGGDKIDMLKEKGVNFFDYPEFFRKGTYLKRELYESSISDEALNDIPEQYRPTGPVIRSRIVKVESVWRNTEEQTVFFCYPEMWVQPHGYLIGK